MVSVALKRHSGAGPHTGADCNREVAVVADVLLETVYKMDVNIISPPRVDLGRDARKLSRRVIVDTSANRIISDGTVHHRAYVSYLRDTLYLRAFRISELIIIVEETAIVATKTHLVLKKI